MNAYPFELNTQPHLLRTFKNQQYAMERIAGLNMLMAVFLNGHGDVEHIEIEVFGFWGTNCLPLVECVLDFGFILHCLDQ